MEKYIYCKEYNSQAVKKIRKDFYRMFSVDLGKEKYYQNTDFEKNWEMLIQDVFRKQKRGASEEYIEEFVGLVNALVNSGKRSDIIRTDEDELNIIQELVCKLRKMISCMAGFPEDYYILEPDIYMNAYLSIKYIKDESIPSEITNTELRKGILMLDGHYMISAKGHEYKVPFKELPMNKKFCLEYQKCLLGKDDVQIFGTSLNADEREEEINIQDIQDFCGYKKRIKISFSKDKKCERWSRKHVLKLEQKLQMEDRVLFYKTINSVLPRNMVDLMVMNQKKFNVYDYLYLIDCLCTCDSIKWKNIIGMITVFGCINKNVLAAYKLWEDLELCIDVWIEQIDTINRRLKCLSNALVYMAYHIDGGVEYIEDMCRKEIAEIERFPYMPNDPLAETMKQRCANIWEKEPKNLIVRIKEPPIDYWWIYAIIQWRIIDNLKSDRCKEIANSKYALGRLVYQFAELYRFLDRVYIKDETLEKNKYRKHNKKKAEKIDAEEILNGLGGVQGLMEICNSVILSLPDTVNQDTNTNDFFQMMNHEAEIRKLFCSMLEERSGYILEPEGSEINRITKYMVNVLRWVEDKNKYLKQ